MAAIGARRLVAPLARSFSAASVATPSVARGNTMLREQERKQKMQQQQQQQLRQQAAMQATAAAAQQSPQQKQPQQQQQQQQQQAPPPAPVPLSPTPPPPSSSGGSIENLTAATFESFVLQSPVPVLVDVWANWCEPCKTLTPLLEAAVRNSKGRLRLAKVDADAEPQLVKAMRATSLPSVFAFFDRRVVRYFVGAQDEAYVSKFCSELLRLGGAQDAAAIAAEADALLRAGELARAVAAFNELLQRDELAGQVLGLAGLARCALEEKDVALAQELVAQIKREHPTQVSQPDVKKALAAVELAGGGGTAGSAELTSLEEAVAAAPTDLAARQRLALAYVDAGRPKDALEQCFASILRDKHFEHEAARQLCLKLFDALGADDELTKWGKKRLNNVWFL